MDLSTSTTSLRQSTGRVGQSTMSGEYGESQRQSPRTTSIHVLDDNSLLHVFYLYRPLFLDKDVFAESRSDECWWYTLAHVCQSWRNVILRSATYLRLSLLCTYGTPVADMLAHSPHFPLVIGYFRNYRELTSEDEEGIVLALQQRSRVRRVHLSSRATTMQRLVVVMDAEYPILEFAYIALTTGDNSSILRLPETFQAPHLYHLTLRGFALPTGSQLLTTAVGLVTLYLVMVHPSTYFHSNTLIQWISLMPQLETLIIYFKFSIPSRDVGRQLTYMPIIAPITFPNLHHFEFRGVSTYLEALAHRISTPRLQEVNINFFNQLTFSGPHLLQFIDAAENLRFGDVVLTFCNDNVAVGVYPRGQTEVYALYLIVLCQHLDWQVSSMAQISNLLRQMFSAVERLVLQHRVPIWSSEEHNEVDLSEWRKLLRPFTNVKTLLIEEGLVKDISRCLQLEDGEFPLELLPELHELEYNWSDDPGDTFTSFIDARKNAGRPVTLIRL